jgi:tetratricopeptide (TPR) repeat protein
MRNYLKIIVVTTAFLAAFTISAQTRVIDSLRQVIASSAHDTLKLDAYYNLCDNYLEIDLDTAEYYAKEAVAKFKDNQNLKYVADIYSILATTYGYKRDLESSLKNYQESLKLLEKTGKKSAIAGAHFNIGLVYYFRSEYKPALEHYITANKLLEEVKDKKLLPTVYNGIATIYKDMRSYGESMGYYRKCLEMYSANKDSVGLSSAYNNVGNVYDYQEKLDEALENYERSIMIKEKIRYTRGMSSTLNNIGIILFKKGKADEALVYYNKALSYSTGPSDDKLSQAISYDGIGAVYYSKQNYPMALSYLQKSLGISTEIDSKIDIISTYAKIASCYGATGNYKKAYEYQELLMTLKDSVLNVENSKQINEMAAKYESEKKQLQIDNLNKDNKLQAEEITRKELEVNHQNMLKLFFAVGFLLVSGLAFFIFRGYKEKKRSGEIILQQKNEVERSRDLVETKNKEITDSIQYAKRIQGALLANAQLMEKNLPSHFVFYKPKDIVSGDFYWAHAQNGLFHLCLGDCTGHGVPGAFMSLLNIAYLNEAVIEKNITSPDKALEHVRQRIISALNPEGAEQKTQDGMDAVLCTFDLKGMWLRFACANNPLWLVRKGELQEFEADKIPVGMHHGANEPFKLHTLGLRKGDSVFLFSDGYADQFGGEKGKKFKYKNLQKLIVENSEKSMGEQKEALATALSKWQGNMEQVDDILIIGVKF